MAIARYFDARHDDGSYFGGVPKRDLSEEEFAALPDWLQASIDASSMYRKTPPPKDTHKDGD